MKIWFPHCGKDTLASVAAPGTFQLGNPLERNRHSRQWSKLTDDELGQIDGNREQAAFKLTGALP